MAFPAPRDPVGVGASMTRARFAAEKLQSARRRTRPSSSRICSAWSRVSSSRTISTAPANPEHPAPEDSFPARQPSKELSKPPPNVDQQSKQLPKASSPIFQHAREIRLLSEIPRAAEVVVATSAARGISGSSLIGQVGGCSFAH